MHDKLRYRIDGKWSRWIYFTTENLTLPDTIEAIEVHEFVTKSQFKEQFPKEYEKFFSSNS